MHKTDATGHASNLFEDKALPGTPGTLIEKHWLNAVQEELIGILTAGGVTPVKGTWTQVVEALKNFLVPRNAVAADYDADSGAQRVVFRTLSSGTTATSELWLTVNARWNGTAWAKDVQAAPALGLQLNVSNDSSGPTYAGAIIFVKQTATVATFADADWATVPPINQIATSMPTSPWTNTGGSLSVMKYWLSPIGDVCLQGTVSHGGGGSGPTVDPLGTLPAGYRPAKDLRFPASYLDTTYKFCTILITSAGVITSDAAVGAAVRLDGIRFPAGV